MPSARTARAGCSSPAATGSGSRDDGLSTRSARSSTSTIPGAIPTDWVVEGFAPEGPKITRHGDWFYLITAVGGTAGPPTGHMVIAARSRSIHGPWENYPAQPAGPHDRRADEKLVVARPRHPGRGPGRRLVDRLSRLRERLLDARPAEPARPDRMDERRLVPDDRRRPVEAASPSRSGGQRGPARPWRSPTISRPLALGKQVGLLRARPRRARAGPGATATGCSLTARGKAPSDPRRCSSSPATRPTGSRPTWRSIPAARAGPDPVLRRAALLRARLRRDRASSPTNMASSAAARPIRTAGGCGCG